VKLYWNIQRLERTHVSHCISTCLVSRPTDPAKGVLTARIILPDAASTTPRMSRILLPIVHQLKWNIQRDRLAKIYRSKSGGASSGSAIAWFEGHGRFYPENERVRLAICPGVRQLKMLFEGRTT